MSLLITNRQRTGVSADTYTIPPRISFQTCRIKEVIITNNFQNVTGQSIDINFGDGNTATVPIENGIYYANEYADYVQTYLNAYSSSSVRFIVQYKETQQRFFVKCENATSNTVTLIPNEKMSVFSGLQEIPFAPNTTSSTLATNDRANIFPSYYTIRSRALSPAQIGYGNAERSDIIAVVPISSSNVVSEYQCNDSVFPQVILNQNYVYNEVDLTIHLEDSYEIIQDPIFAIKVEFR